MQDDQSLSGVYQETLDASDKKVLTDQNILKQPISDACLEKVANPDSFWEWEVSHTPERLLETSCVTEAIEGSPPLVRPVGERLRSKRFARKRQWYALASLVLLIPALAFALGKWFSSPAGLGSTHSQTSASQANVLLTAVTTTDNSSATRTATVVAVEIPTATSVPAPGAQPASATTSTPTPIATPAASKLTCSVLYQVLYRWKNKMWVSITVTNTSTTTLHNWKLVFTFPNSHQQISQEWNGIFSQQGTKVTVSNTSDNRTVPPGETISPGYSSTGGSNYAPPTSFTLNGVSCRII
jgi:hypothetical protein